MNKLAFFILLVFSFSGAAIAQMPEISVERGPENKMQTKDKEEIVIITRDEQGGYYTLQERYKYLYGQVTKIKRSIEHFDRNWNLLGPERFTGSGKKAKKRL